MNSAYNTTALYNLAVNKDAKQWYKKGYIGNEEYTRIKSDFVSDVYHPNFTIRILLFVASVLALAGFTGVLSLLFSDLSEITLWSLSAVYGVSSFVILETLLIRSHKHFKTGLNEAVIYHACLFTILGASGIADFNETFTFIVCIAVFSFTAWRYLDLLTTIAAFVSFFGFLFYRIFEISDLMGQLIPLIFIIISTPLFFLARQGRKNPSYALWENVLTLLEALLLLMIYAAGNYFVVRELSIDLMGLVIEEGSDMPFAIVFYMLTIVIPLAYLYFGIKTKDIILLRVSLVAIFFSVFTFKYYFSFGHPEITFTISGIVITTLTLAIMNYLRISRNGYTRENLIEEKWGGSNIHSVVVSQTMGGNVAPSDDSFKGGGGGFGGGGATGEF